MTLDSRNLAHPSAALPSTLARLQIRSGAWTKHTSGLADSYVQANLVILPKQQANDFLLYCQRNPKPCPLLAVSEPGDFRLLTLAADLDIRTDVPRYGKVASCSVNHKTLNPCGETIL
jgi:uncharacterized protein YcsI (UPF0317 family)